MTQSTVAARSALAFLLTLGMATAPAGAQERAAPDPPPLVGVAGTTVDRGVGVAYLRSELESGSRAPVESLTVRTRPLGAAPVIAHMVRRDDGPGRGWSYALLGLDDDAAPALLEFDYEIQGLPIDHVSPDSGWARVIVGHDHLGRPRSGWLALDTARVAIMLWRDHLPEREWLFFVDRPPPPVFDRPGGRALGADSIFSPDGGHSLYVEDVRADWMLVRIVSPDDSCGQAVDSPRVTRAWVRYLDAAGRPRVWYHTRGC